ncbi:uncharacterized protein [Prorops nasuta]|uniref:uncharacterized protein n=1 Tax=Prorops nasuta TaxID=863751 RepID=UPI0034CD579D
MTSGSSTGSSTVCASSSQRPNIHRVAAQSVGTLNSSTSHDAAKCLAKEKTSLEDILLAVRGIGDSQKDLTLKVNTLLELPQRMEDCIDRVNELRREQDALSGRICLLEEQHAQLAARVECLDSRPPGVQNANADASQIQALTSAINNIEMKQHSCDLTVSGIPESVESDVGDFLRRLFAIMGLTVALSDMTGIRRMRSTRQDSTAPRLLIVTLATEQLRDRIIAAKRSLSGIADGALSPGINVRRIFINEFLPPRLHALLSSARALGRERGYRVWAKRGSVFAGKGDGARPIRIESDADLTRLA